MHRRPSVSRSARCRLRLCVIATIGKSIQVLYAGRLEHFVAGGFDVTVVCASSELDSAIRAQAFVCLLSPSPAPSHRGRTCASSGSCIASSGPSGLISSKSPRPKARCSDPSPPNWRGRVAWCIFSTACRIGKAGLLGSVLRWSTRIPCRLAHVTYSVSASVRDEALKDDIARPGTVTVLGAGSAQWNRLDAVLAGVAPKGRRCGNGSTFRRMPSWSVLSVV